MFLKRLFSKGKNFINRNLSRGKRIIGRLSSFAEKSPLIMKNATKLEELNAWEKTLIKIIDQTYQKTRTLQIEDLNLVFQDTTTVAYLNSEDLIIGFRGTDSLQDVLTDIDIVKHNENKNERFLEDLKRYDGLIEKYPGRNITLVGHSLGSAIALFVNSKRDSVNEVYIVNPAINLRNILQSYTRNNRGNVTIIRTPNDPVSLLAVLTGYRIKTVPGKESLIGTHKLDNFLE